MKTKPIPEELLCRDHFLKSLDPNNDFTLRQAYDAFNHLYHQMQQSPDGTRRGIVGMADFIEAILMILITGQHLLIRGVPGLAKTKAVLLLASLLGAVFRRIQSTPDLMPSDMQYRDQLEIDGDSGKHKIEWYPGPVFANLVLNDEIDRATPKTQSALLEVMEEKKVSVHGRGCFPARPMKNVSDNQLIDEAKQLEELHTARKGKGFFNRKPIVLENKDELALFFIATQNGIEQEGTYPLPEAQIDRFLLMSLIENPPHRDLEAIAADSFVSNNGGSNPKRFLDEHLKTLYFLVMVKEKLLSESVRNAFFQSHVWKGIRDLWECTHLTPMFDGGQKTQKGREVWRRIKGTNELHLQAVEKLMELPQSCSERMPRIELGSSPRGLLGIIRAAHALALLEESFIDDNHVKVLWSHVRKVAPLVLRHRIKLNQADAHSFSTDYVIEKLLGCFKDDYFKD